MRTKKDIIQLFENPGAEYRGKPFWSWNGELRKEELYDEDRWPSGSAGGKVTVDPQYRMKSMVLYCYDRSAFDWNREIPGENGYEVIAVFAARIEGRAVYEFVLCEDQQALAEALKEEQYNKVLVFRIVPNAPASVYG